MDNKSFPRKLKIYLPLILLLALLISIMPRATKFPYDYKRGELWRYETLTARFDFPILKSEQKIIEEKQQVDERKMECYVLDSDVAFEVKSLVAQKNMGYYNLIKPILSDTLETIFSVGVMSNEALAGKTWIKLQRSKKERFQEVPVSEVYTVSRVNHILNEILRKFRPSSSLSSVFTPEECAILLRPNVFYDGEATEEEYRMAYEDVSTTLNVFRTGNLIVTEGEVITGKTKQILDSYKAEYNATAAYDGAPIFMWMGNIFLSLVLVAMIFFVIYFCDNRVFAQYNKYIFLLVVFMLPSLLTSLVSGLNENIYFIIPYSLISLYLYSFFKPRLVFSVYVVSLLPVMFLAPDGFELFIMHLAAGTVCMAVFNRFSRGWLQFVSVLISFVVMTGVWFSFRMVEGIDATHDYTVIFSIALSALLLVAAYPLVYLFEKIFGLVSKSKLEGLTDTSGKLLRMLADKAPGTFQHCLQVMNLAEAAARSIDADVPLIKAGAMYHDIGKISNPHCFTENSTTDASYHSELTPQESAHDIIKHVSDGIVLADKHGLPQVIKDFILSHHGTTKVGYFYTKYLNDGGDPDDVEVFTYDGKKPETKEQVILMLCDAIEAASRSLKGYSPENISALVDKIFEQKIEAGQLSESRISYRELGVVKESIKSYLVQMYHSRVAYPKRRK